MYFRTNQIEDCEEQILKYATQLENMDSKYLDKAIDELDVIQRELAELKESVGDISKTARSFIAEYVLQDIRTKL